jgi:hypothetical protein
MSFSSSLGPSLENVNTNATTELAVRLRGVVKRYGEITAVGGLDLDVPYGTCVGLLVQTAPARRRRTVWPCGDSGSER